MRFRCLSAIFLLAVLIPVSALAQTATTTTVSGMVTDATGAAVAGATVKLTDTTTNTERTVTTDTVGRYNFYAVSPGLLKLTVTAQGFKTKVITDVKAETTTVATVNVALEVGQVEVIEQVTAGVEAQLQTADASVGSVFDESRLKQLPNVNRQVNSLFALQPATTPTGEFAGARNDQTVISLDGVDVSDNVIGQTFRTIIPVPVDTIEEFRGTSANANATFGRSSGGQISMVTKSGTNSLHGSAYWYHQDNALAANSWTNNRLGIKRPFLLDNRFGGTVGGPIIKDRTFFFLAYEGRRNPRSASVTRIVPTDTYKQGIMRFRDASGVIQTIDQNALKALDPRSIGASPKVLEYLKLYPSPNDFTQGDGLNTAGFTFAAPLITQDDFSLGKVDHKFSEKWNFSGKFSANRQLNTNAGQVDIQNKVATGNSPQRPRNAVATLTGVLTPTLTNQASFSWLHDRLDFQIISPKPFVGLNAAINLGNTIANGGVLDDIIDVDTQRARHQFRTLNIYQWADTVSWTKGGHNIQGGTNIRRIRSVDFRDDKVIGSITTPVAAVSTEGGFVTIPASQRPGFVTASDTSRYNDLYASLLGIVSQVPALITRDANLKLQPLGTGLFTKSTLGAYEFYASDTWRIKPSLTLTYGLTYNWQTPPIEDSGKQTVIAFKDSGKLVDYKKYMADKLAAAEQGVIYNPDLAYLPLKNAGRDTAYDTDFADFSPRLSIAWNPSFKDGWMGKAFGDRKTVIRGGYSLVYDRTNTVQTIIIPTLGVGFAQTVNITAPKNSNGDPFRIGVDGPIPLPTVPQQLTSPVIPDKPFGETLSFSVDPFIKVPRNHVINLTIQRDLPWRLLMEVGYIGRYARDLYMNGNMNSVPYTFKDAKSGQTFAQAFDAVALALRNKQTVAPQPYFENLYGAGATLSLASSRSGDFINGLVSNLAQINIDALKRGCQPGAACTPLTNLQSQDLLVRFSGGFSNYHGMILTLRKRFSQGLAFDFNYTFAKSYDNSGLGNQNNVAEFQNSFFPELDYGPSIFDIRHIVNANYVYELPFGKGRRWDISNGFLSRIISGWTLSGIITGQSGLPLTVAQNAGQAFGGGSIGGFIPNSGAIPLVKSLFGQGVHSGVAGSGGVGVSGNPANRGTGLNLFEDPLNVFNSFRFIQLSKDGRHGRNVLRGLRRITFDTSIVKETRITERVRFTLGFDFINAFNHPIFNNPTLNLQTPANFGVLSSQFENIGGATNGTIGPRRIQVSGRFDF
ncbi:MAG: carboxypeptidase-like regulatory domain-containing protein [Blastocatellia bacterium]